MTRRRRDATRPRRASRPWRKITALAALAAVSAASVFAWLVLSPSGEPPGPPKAAIVDQLSLTFPNPAFVDDTIDKLERTGYVVDYYPGEEVTVDFYRRLPIHGYDLIIFRTHASRLQARWRGEEIDEVVLFSSERYSRTKYHSDQAANRLLIARYYEGGPGYFGISPSFFDDKLGRFDGATIIMMGCEGLLTDRTAEAFVEKGAKTYISWDESVSAAHTDAATERLLQHLLIEGRSPEEAVELTMAEVGPDPTYGSRLLAYPPGG